MIGCRRRVRQDEARETGRAGLHRAWRMGSGTSLLKQGQGKDLSRGLAKDNLSKLHFLFLDTVHSFFSF